MFWQKQHWKKNGWHHFIAYYMTWHNYVDLAPLTNKNTNVVINFLNSFYLWMLAVNVFCTVFSSIQTIHCCYFIINFANRCKTQRHLIYYFGTIFHDKFAKKLDILNFISLSTMKMVFLIRCFQCKNNRN